MGAWGPPAGAVTARPRLPDLSGPWICRALGLDLGLFGHRGWIAPAARAGSPSLEVPGRPPGRVPRGGGAGERATGTALAADLVSIADAPQENPMAVTLADPLKIILAILLPPVGVFTEVGLTKHFWINLLLTILGYVPGIIHALWVILKY